MHDITSSVLSTDAISSLAYSFHQFKTSSKRVWGILLHLFLSVLTLFPTFFFPFPSNSFYSPKLFTQLIFCASTLLPHHLHYLTYLMLSIHSRSFFHIQPAHSCPYFIQGCFLYWNVPSPLSILMFDITSSLQSFNASFKILLPSF